MNLLEVEEKVLSNSPDREAIEIRFILKDQSVICFQDANDHFTCCKGKIYLPVYDVQQAIDNTYSFYEDKDLIGFILQRSAHVRYQIGNVKFLLKNGMR